MNNEIIDKELELARQMFKFANLDDYTIELGDKGGKIFFINHKGVHQYELWEVSSIWSVSTIDRDLIKKHEDFYFVMKALIVQLFEKEMDVHFDKHEDEPLDLDSLEV